MASQDYTIELLLKANNQLSGELENVQGQINKIERQVNTASSSVNSAFSMIKKWIWAIWITALVTKVSKSIVTLWDNLERAQLSFSTMLWSAEKAEALLNDLSDFARKTPFELTGVRDNAKQLLAMWIEAEKVVPTLKALWDVSAWVWVSLERVTLNYWQVLTQWKLTGKDLRDFMTQWIPLLDELANNLWKTKSEIQDMVSAWKIWFADVEEAFRTMTSEWWRFEDLMNKQATTLTWLWSNFQDTLNWIGEEIWQNLLPILKWYVEQISTWVEDNKDLIIEVAKEVVETFKAAADSIISIISWIGSVIDWLWSFFTDIINWMLWDTNEWLSWMTGDWSDFFYIVQQWLTWIWKSLSLVMNTISSVLKTVWKKTFWSWLKEAMYWNDKIWIWSVEYWIQPTIDYLKNAFKNTKDVVKDWANDLVKSLEDNYINKLQKTLSKWATTIQKENKSLFDYIKDITWWGGIWWAWWWWSWNTKTNTEALKKIQDVYKSITKDVDNQYDSIIKLNKEWENWFKDLEKNLDSVDKTIANLKDDISDLKKSLSDLWKEETSSIAEEFVNARRELQKMERDYAWIGEVAQKYSMDYLENYTHWWIGKYDIDALIQYKKYSDEMASVYDWLNASERKAMDEQIAYQDWYQSLNGIEKIREDYRIKREEIQWELNEKMSALRQEEIKRAEIEKQMAQYRKEWLETLNVEIKKRVDMYLQKMDYEKKYMEELEINHEREMQMYDELIRKLKEVAKAKQEAWEWWSSWTRANWWPVYEWQQYLVWEHWPELFIPSQNWSIVKNEDLWKWQEFTINVNMWWVVVNDWQDTEQLAETIANTITRQLELYKKGIY